MCRVKRSFQSAILRLAPLALASGLCWSAPGAPGGPVLFPVEDSGREVRLEVDSGALSGEGSPIWETMAGEDGASWIRVVFGTDTRLRRGSVLRLTSLEDGAVQHLDAQALKQWSFTSAYFNGSHVLVELMVHRGVGPRRVVIDGLWAGKPFGPVETLCSGDDRTLSSDPRNGRMLAAGCTAWLLNECLITAGHCMGSNTVVQFNVPFSSDAGSLNHPAPSDQYTIDIESRQFSNAGLGNDWAYFGVFPNTETGLTALEAQGQHYQAATSMPAPEGQILRVTGYGTDSTPPQVNQVQQTSLGPLQAAEGNVLSYETDTTGGSSGSALVDESSGRAMGIHTNAGCDVAPPPYNQGTSLANEQLQHALRHPQGRCAAQAACNGNGVCESGEDCFNCPGDCGYAPPGGTSAPSCGDGICRPEDGEDCAGCPEDCNGGDRGRRSERYCCGLDTFCDDPRCSDGAVNCSAEAGLESASGYCCGDGVCEDGENDVACAVDCALTCSDATDCNDLDGCTIDSCGTDGRCTHEPGDCCVPTHTKEKGRRCGDGIDNDCDGLADADDPDCSKR
jgi:V8-like Glu-specific endopeptidase